MDKIVFKDGWQAVFEVNGFRTFEDFFLHSDGECFNKNSRREVIRFSLNVDGRKNYFFMKRFYEPHFKDILFGIHHAGFGGSQARLEWQNANTLLDNGIGTYPPVCYGQETKLNVERKSFFITEELKSQAMTDFVAKRWHNICTNEKSAIISDVGKFIRKIHDADISLPDLYLWHIYIGGKGTSEFDVIDLHRMKSGRITRREKLKNLGRMLHSMSDDYFDDEHKRQLIKSYIGSNEVEMEDVYAQSQKFCQQVNAKRNCKPY